MAQVSVTLDVRLLFAEELSELLQASAELLTRYPRDSRLRDLRVACEKFAGAPLPVIKPSNN